MTCMASRETCIYRYGMYKPGDVYIPVWRVQGGCDKGGQSVSRTKKRLGQKAEAFFGAENETRTRDPDLGKVVLYQLSYFRNWDCKDISKK